MTTRRLAALAAGSAALLTGAAMVLPDMRTEDAFRHGCDPGFWCWTTEHGPAGASGDGARWAEARMTSISGDFVARFDPGDRTVHAWTEHPGLPPDARAEARTSPAEGTPVELSLPPGAAITRGAQPDPTTHEGPSAGTVLEVPDVGPGTSVQVRVCIGDSYCSPWAAGIG